MGKHVLITGGAGFVGSHLADALLERGYRVRALDNLSPQVHGPDARRPSYLADDVELIVGDVRDPEAVKRSLEGIDAVFHFASVVGVGQSMYEISRYTDVNNVGTAVLLEALTRNPVERLVVASSMSLYGEGLYRTPNGTVVPGIERSLDRLKAGDWEVRDAQGEVLSPVPTPEDKTPGLPSIYALSKYDQERMCLCIGRAYGIPTTALRFFNIYGTRQALSNPYTGVLAIFASRFLNGRPPMINEDGYQRRDFVSVYDVARACILALESPRAPGEIFNVGSGNSYTIREIAQRMAIALARQDVQPQITGTYRVGDIRHCFADISRARELLGYRPRVSLEEGLVELAGWLEGQIAIDAVDNARAELESRGLAIGAAEATPPRPDRPARLERVGKEGRDDTAGASITELGSRSRRASRAAERPVLITGGAGFIGTNLAHKLLSSGRRVVIYDNLSRAGVEQNVRWLQGVHGDRVRLEVADVRDASRLRAVVSEAAQVFHFAAQVAVTTSLVEPIHDFDVNARGTLNLLEAIRAQKNPPPLVFTSTNKVYGGLDDITLRLNGDRYEPEDSTLRASGVSEARRQDFHSPYGCSKGAADQYVIDYARTFDLPAVVFRMSCIYGPHQHGNEDQGWVAHFLIQALQGRTLTLYGDGKQVRDILFIEDLVRAFLLAQEHMPRVAGEAFNIGGGPANTISLLELLDMIHQLTGDRVVTRFDAARPGDQRYYVSDTSKFRQATGWAPGVGVREGVERLHEWLLEARGEHPVQVAAEAAR